MKLDVDFVRSRFPALSGSWIFMDNAGGSQVVQSVIDRISEYLIHSNVQLGADYDISKLAGQRVNSGAEIAAELVNAKEPSEIIIGSSTTMLLRILALSVSKTLAPGDEIIVTNGDHEANIGAWVELEKMGVIIKFWEINQDTFQMNIEDLKLIMTEKTKMVAVTHTSNILGTLFPIKEIAKVVHNSGALICVDGVAHAPHRLVDVQDLDVDFYALSFYKVFGPHISMLYGKKELLLKLPGISHFFIDESNVPYKFQPGSPNYELSYGVAGLKDYFTALAEAHEYTDKSFRKKVDYCFKLIADHEQHLAAKLLEFLNLKKNVKIIGEIDSDKDKRVPTISFAVDKTKSSTITEQIDKRKIGIRYGDFYARRLIDDLGLSKQDGVVRVSLVHYNTSGEVEQLIKFLDPLI